MPSVVLFKELRLLDLVNDIYKFYNIQVITVGYNDLQIIFHHGKAGTKGTKTMLTSKSYKEAMATAYSKFHEKKAKGYEEREDLMGWLGQNNTVNKNINSPKNKKENSIETNSTKVKITYKCDDCKKPIKKEVYEEISKWARGGGGWDKNKDFITYKKVLCISCQWKHDVFKKRL